MDELLWYVIRGSGIVALVLSGAVMVMGLLSMLRFRRPDWPPFANGALHKNLSLLTAAFLGVHIVTTIMDPLTSIGVLGALVPFMTSVSPLWMAFGIVSFYLGIALVVSSLLRRHVGARTWRLLHWSSYLAFPAAVAHTVGMGTDATAPWMIGIMVASVWAVVWAAITRFAAGRPAAAVAAPARLAR